MKNLRLCDFQSLLGGTLPKTCIDMIETHDWSYETIEGAELNSLVADILGRVALKNFSLVKTSDNSRWIKGWSENLAAYKASGNIKDLEPKYVRSGLPLRLFGRFIKPNDPDFEKHWYRLFQEYIFRSHLDKASTIYEFGCGSGINVALLAEMYPDKKIVGLDWAQPSGEICDEIGRRGGNVEGRLFNFFDPDCDLLFDKNSAVFTFGALEQTSDRWGSFIEFLLSRRPELCVFIEPIYEWYDPINLGDWLAMRVHDTRGFMKGLRPYVHALVRDGDALMVRDKRAWFGSLLLEGYSQLIFKPVI